MCLFFFNYTATTEIYPYLHTLSLHDALPILGSRTVLDEAADKLVGIDAAAVAAEFDDDLIARLTRRYGEAAVLALARGAALGGGFDTVIERVADDVAQRIAHHLATLATKLDKIGRAPVFTLVTKEHPV